MSIRDKIVLAIGFPIITALWIAGWILIMMPTKKKAIKQAIAIALNVQREAGRKKRDAWVAGKRKSYK